VRYRRSRSQWQKSRALRPCFASYIECTAACQKDSRWGLTKTNYRRPTSREFQCSFIHLPTRVRQWQATMALSLSSSAYLHAGTDSRRQCWVVPVRLSIQQKKIDCSIHVRTYPTTGPSRTWITRLMTARPADCGLNSPSLLSARWPWDSSYIQDSSSHATGRCLQYRDDSSSWRLTKAGF
jgi:hypothetical protein